MERKIYVSGMNCGQNPSSGLGIARCLKRAFPKIKIVGVDHSQGATGLHDPIIDEVMLLPRWDQIHDELHAQHIREILDAGNLWIASMDMEVHWISENVGAHPNLLAPGGTMLEETSKPAVKAFASLGFKVPEFIPASLPDSDIHSFLRHYSWQCWLKSPYHDAKRVSSWSTFERAREFLSTNWKTGRLFLQRNIIGNEETIAFGAYQGELVDAVHMEKRQITPEGKTWAGRVSPVHPRLLEKIAHVVKTLGWSGGGELEFVRDSDGQEWMIECNPRFPAWIYGSALAGMNLPGRLISRIWDLPLTETRSTYPLFTRIVQEIPAKEEIGIPLPADAGSVMWMGDSKTGKGGSFSSFLPNLEAARDQKEHEHESAQEPESIPGTLLDEIQKISGAFAGETPSRVFLDRWSNVRFEALANRVKLASMNQPKIQIGYSVKTSPTDHHLQKAKQFGFFAECISQMEVQRALSSGFPSENVILNGPGKFWPLTMKPTTGLHLLFCDSIEEFERVLETPHMAKTIGFRIRLPKVSSRFGLPIDDFDRFQDIVRSIRKLKGKAELGFHFHMPSWSIGVKRWTEALQSLLFWCQTVEKLTGVSVRTLDLGGGFFPEDLGKLDFTGIQKIVHETLPSVTGLYFEPGRALTQETEVVVSRVLDVRKGSENKLTEIVVDACIAELPLAQAFPHRMFYRPSGGVGESAGENVGDSSGSTLCVPLTKGKARILGRICMEDDILCHDVELPETVKIGDQVIFGDAGGYERSMSYVFGRG